ncbi:Asp/Glu racemase [Xylophilus sp. Kf1]|nr:Asp/Glu racemase [Xylophilus sp. Kf1]
MRLLVVNPNRSAGMTGGVVDEVRRLLARIGRDDVVVQGATCAGGPEVIASPSTFAAGAAALAAEWPMFDDPRIDAVLLACFGDPALAELRALAGRPVAGMATAALDAALVARERFHIVTAGAAWDGMLRALIATHPAAPLLDGITILPSDGLAASRDGTGTVQRLQQVLRTLEQRGAPRCILGGAGFAGMRPALVYGGVLTDGIEAATAQLLASSSSH